MRRIFAKSAGLVCLLLIFLSFSLGFISAQKTDSGSNLVIGEGETVVISGPSYGVKGDIRIREEGTLEIRTTSFEIYQETDNQFQIDIEGGGSLKLIDSSLSSDKKIDIHTSADSEVKIIDSELDTSGKITGSTEQIEVKKSELHVQEVNIQNENLVVRDSVIHADRWLASSPSAYLNESVFHTGLTFHSDSNVKLYGTVFEDIETNQGADAEVFGKVSISVEDTIGVPIGGADINVERLMKKDHFTASTDGKGEWTRYLPSERLGSGDSSYFGNYQITVGYQEEDIEKTFSLPPVEKRGPGSDDEIGKEMDFKFSKVMPPSSHYDSSKSDINMENTTERVIETYPEQGIETYIQQGNIELSDGRLIIGENSNLKVLQKEKRYRVELENGAQLRMKKNSTIKSDRPLNFYLYDGSRLSLKGADLDVGSIYVGDSSQFIAKNSRIRAGDLYLEGGKFETENSFIDSEKLVVDSESTVMKRSNVVTDTNVTLQADSFELTDLDFNNPVHLESENEEITVTNLTSPEVVPEGGLKVRMRWYVNVEVYNGHERLVPSTNLEIYRQDPVENINVKSMFIPEGKASVPLTSKIITSERSRFIGNYILEGNKSVNGDVVNSETTLVAVDGNVKARVRFKEDFPYSLVINVDLPKKLNPGESFVLEGRATYEGVDLQVENASVELMINHDEDLKWNTTTDEMGRFSIKAKAPSAMGANTIKINVQDEDMMMDSEKSHSLQVGRDDESSLQKFLFTTTSGRFITMMIIIGLVILAYSIVTTPMKSEKGSISSSENMVKWAEKSLKESE
ncbi:MAG: hypothetical protein KGY76_05585 [Candidatus Thermoplasmatota archaeon]|nr:hypothetical protein [Candidatus Thermoplasmatota archaeon]